MTYDLALFLAAHGTKKGWRSLIWVCDFAELHEPIVAARGPRVLYPSTPSVHETGARRGCVVLAKNTALALALTSLPLLREAAPLVYGRGQSDE